MIVSDVLTIRLRRNRIKDVKHTLPGYLSIILVYNSSTEKITYRVNFTDNYREFYGVA